MKVLQINSVCGIRSTGRICTDIANLLKTGGDDSKIGYGRETVLKQHEQFAVRIGTRLDELLHAAMSRIFDNTGFGSKRATKRFLKWVEEYDPDIIHLHNIHGYYIHIGLLFEYLKKAKKPVVWTLHDCWAFTGHCSYFSRVDCEKWEKCGCHSCPQKKGYPSSLFIDRSKKNFLEKRQLFTGLDNMTIVAPSVWLADLAKRSFLGDYPVKVIHNGINLSVFRQIESDVRERYGLHKKKIFLGVASSWGDRKGFADIVQLAELLDENEIIVLVGLTEQQTDDLPDNVIGISKTNNVEELVKIYSAADIFINPTYEDNYPTVNLEAQACGTPVVTYRTGGSVESVPTEHIVEQGDVAELLKKARKIVNCSPPLLYDVRTFSANDRYEEYCRIYRTMLESVS